MSLSIRAQFTPRSNLGRYVETVINPAVRDAVEQSCELIQSTAQALCPVDTGALQASIIVAPINDTGKTIVGTVGTDLYYAGYVEWGTGQRGAASAGAGEGPYSPSWPGQAAQPFMRPAVDESRGKVKDIFVSNVKAVLA